MGKRGFPPAPTKLKVLRGNPGKRKINESEPKPKEGIPAFPEWLDDITKEEWYRIAPELDKLGILTIVDGLALAACCRAYSKWRMAEENIMKHGMIMKTATGYIQQSPYISIANQSMKEMRQLLCEFGMTPSSRSQVKVNEKIEEDEFTQYLKDK